MAFLFSRWVIDKVFSCFGRSSVVNSLFVFWRFLLCLLKALADCHLLLQVHRVLDGKDLLLCGFWSLFFTLRHLFLAGRLNLDRFRFNLNFTLWLIFLDHRLNQVFNFLLFLLLFNLVHINQI